jgi:hypothetical protein
MQHPLADGMKARHVFPADRQASIQFHNHGYVVGAIRLGARRGKRPPPAPYKPEGPRAPWDRRRRNSRFPKDHIRPIPGPCRPRSIEHRRRLHRPRPCAACTAKLRQRGQSAKPPPDRS